jgi:hypothetical protein
VRLDQIFLSIATPAAARLSPLEVAQLPRG